MAKTRAQLRQRLLDSGFSYLASGQVNDFLDEAALEFCLLTDWAWRVKSEAAAPSPVQVGATLGPVIAVLDAQGKPVYPRSREELEDRYDLAEIGPARHYYVTDTAVATWPAGATITVRHYARNPWVTGGHAAADDNDTLRCDLDGEDIVYQLARGRCKDFNDDFDEAQAIRTEALRRASELVEAEVDQVDEPDVIGLSEYY